MGYELLELVLVEVVSGVESIESALAMLSSDHVGAAHEDNGDELEGSVDGVYLVF